MNSQQMARCSGADFVRLFEQHGATKLSKMLGVSQRNIYERRKNFERELGREILPPERTSRVKRTGIEHPARYQLTVKDGCVLVASDCHYWPEIITTAHRAFVRFCRELQPRAVILNGDVLDGATISRHPPIGWETRPKLVDELEACKDRLDEIQKACRNADKIWTLGNHDGRFETRLATLAPEYAKVHGVHLRDHFPGWRPAWSCWINDEVVVKHRWKGGDHATWNNAIRSGKTMVTGHLHKLEVRPYSDYNGVRFGVDTGTLAEPGGPQFVDYTEDGPQNWRSGFIVLSFSNGRLLWPEIVHVIDEGLVEFRGKVYEV